MHLCVAMMAPHTKLGEVLLHDGLLSAADLTHALKTQAQSGGPLGDVLLRLNMVDEAQLLAALSRQTGAPQLDLAGITIPVEVQTRVRFDTARTRHLLPVRMLDGALQVGMLDPSDAEALRDLEFETGLGITPTVVSARQLSRLLALADRQGWGKAALLLPASDPRRLAGLAGLLGMLVEARGQDLHLAADAAPSIRVDGELVRLDQPPLAGHDIAELVGAVLTPEQRQGFRGALELDFAHVVDGVGRFRCNLYRQRGTLTFTARHVPSRIPTPAELGLPPWVAAAALERQGLILLTAPNGHGKSTTLASLVDVINRERRANVITLEDPIEFVHTHQRSNVNQREVGLDTHSFAEGLRRIFRQNPDVIVFGELRDAESIAVALSAAESGHLVMATMHSLNATTAINRLIDAFPDDQRHQTRAQLADALLLVLSQRLVRHVSGRGRVLAYEKVATSLRVRNAIREDKVHTLRQLVQSNLEELTSIDVRLAELVATEQVTLQEAGKWADDPRYLAELVRVRGGKPS